MKGEKNGQRYKENMRKGKEEEIYRKGKEKGRER